MHEKLSALELGFTLNAGSLYFMGCFGGAVEVGDEDEAFVYPTRAWAEFDRKALASMATRDTSIPAFVITPAGRALLAERKPKP